MVLGFHIVLAQGIEHRHLFLAQVAVNRKAVGGHFGQQVSAGKPHLPQVWQGNAKSVGGLLVVGLNLSREFDGLGKDVAQLPFEVFGTTAHTVKEILATQVLERHRKDFLLPLGSHVDDLLSQG